MKLGKYAKAIVAAAAAGTTTLLSALADEKVSTGEWVLVGLAVLGALGVTWAVPNTPEEPTSRRLSM